MYICCIVETEVERKKKQMKCYSVISGKNGEILFPHIVFDKYARESGGFSVGKDFFSTSEKALSGMVTKPIEIYKRGQKVTRQSLVSFDLDKSPQRIIPREHIWDERDDEKHPYVALIFIQGPKEKSLGKNQKRRTGISLRCPQPKEFWKGWVKAEQLENKDDIRATKNALKDQFKYSPYLEDNGSRIILPSDYEDREASDYRSHYTSYLVACSEGADFEIIYARQGRLPNAYQVSVRGGEVFLTNPREEIKKELGL